MPVSPLPCPSCGHTRSIVHAAGDSLAAVMTQVCVRCRPPSRSTRVTLPKRKRRGPVPQANQDRGAASRAYLHRTDAAEQAVFQVGPMTLDCGAA